MPNETMEWEDASFEDIDRDEAEAAASLAREKAQVRWESRRPNWVAEADWARLWNYFSEHAVSLDAKAHEETAHADRAQKRASDLDIARDKYLQAVETTNEKVARLLARREARDQEWERMRAARPDDPDFNPAEDMTDEQSDEWGEEEEWIDWAKDPWTWDVAWDADGNEVENVSRGVVSEAYDDALGCARDAAEAWSHAAEAWQRLADVVSSIKVGN